VHPIVELNWKLEAQQGRFHLPAGRGLGSALFFGRPLLRNFWNTLLQALIREPALRYRCSIGTGLRLYGPPPDIMGDGPISIGDRVEIAAPASWVIGFGLPEPAALHIGSDVRMGPHNIICAAKSVRIGNHCRTGPNVAIYYTDVHPLNAAQRRQNYGTMHLTASAPVTIEDDVWIGVGAIVLKGVTIGAGAIVGAGSVVTRDVAANSIVAGNPAVVVGQVDDNPLLQLEVAQR
jgi:acetyltransferase-like isoleucine patch superfamily enzyme